MLIMTASWELSWLLRSSVYNLFCWFISVSFKDWPPLIVPYVPLKYWLSRIFFIFNALFYRFYELPSVCQQLKSFSWNFDPYCQLFISITAYNPIGTKPNSPHFLLISPMYLHCSVVRLAICQEPWTIRFLTFRPQSCLSVSRKLAHLLFRDKKCRWTSWTSWLFFTGTTRWYRYQTLI